MHLKNIKLNQFKNYKQERAVFSKEINCFLGMNGSGKTNLLDAIHYLCFTRSAFNSIDSQNILHYESFFTIAGEFDREGKDLELRCIFEAGKKKQLVLAGKAYEKMSDHIGQFPVVMIAPDDIQLIKGGSEDRRKFVDSMLSQLDRNYLQSLVRYQHFLKQRNALLKQFAEGGRFDKELLEPYNIELISLSKVISQKRLEFIENFSPKLEHHYRVISDSKEAVSVGYESHCEPEGFEKVFRDSLHRDLALKRTNKGIHRDDFAFEIDGFPLKKYGSQGQQKSYLIALKLSQFQVLEEGMGVKPILLLDDIFDKLDDARIEKMVSLVADHQFGQLFITDARPERSKQILASIDSEKAFFRIDNGTIRAED
ncbi:DNA replication and repair protein RecF [Litoribacter ruber]|uniref:DNA replication/repair protein RecF n=1 Tax=Litoribacter ruber TaxID=702568 RepID=UPI001BD922A0|nr:DNA replication and repair protein RecF [Litoribacter ruber]MBT0812064.1 DNA replication and repair protein RecF [Litoribacter ruber]